jgi:hypothetical protein
MRGLAAAAAIAGALALPAAGAVGSQPVLGIDGPNQAGQLAWFDPATLSVLRGRKALLGAHTGAWAFSADRSVVGIGEQEHPSIRFVNARTMRVLGDLRFRTDSFASLQNLAWVRADRLLATVVHDNGSFVAVVDPQRRRTLKRVDLEPTRGAARIPGGVALLLGTTNGFAAAQVAVVDAEGAVRKVVLDRIQIGFVQVPGNEPSADLKEPGFAVDPIGRRAFVVGGDFTVAEVDLDTLAVAYHNPSARSLAKNITGPSRVAAWLGNGMLAVSGFDYTGGDNGQPVGLRLIDTRNWTYRMLDPSVGWFDAAGGMIVAVDKVFGLDGSMRYRVDLAGEQWLSAQGQYGYVCENGQLRRVMQLATGTTMTSVQGTATNSCPTLLYAQSSS